MKNAFGKKNNQFLRGPDLPATRPDLPATRPDPRTDPLWRLSLRHCRVGPCTIVAQLSAGLPSLRAARQGIAPKSSARRAKCCHDSRCCHAPSSRIDAPLAAAVPATPGCPIFPCAPLLTCAAAAPTSLHHCAAAGHRNAGTSGLSTSCAA
jgi:hypothetical protein